MKFVYSGKGMEVSDSLQARVEKKLGKLDRYFDRMPGAENRTLRPALVKDGQVLVKGLYAEGSGRA